MGVAAPIATGLAIAQAGVGIVGAISQQNQANQAAADQRDAAQKQATATYNEIVRQQGEVNRIATEQVSDRVRQANADLGTASVAASERGVSGSTMSAITRNIAYLEGADVSRIEGNRAANIAAGEAQKVSAKNGYIDTVNIANNQAAAATTSAWLGAAGSGLQIAGNYYTNQQKLAAQTNERLY